MRRRRPGRPKDPARAARRREEIVAAAARLFAEHGYASTDIQVLADRLGVGKGTVYRYFPTKRELFLATVARGMKRMQEAAIAAAAEAEDPLDAIVLAFRGCLAFFEENPDVVELLVQERAELGDRERSLYFENRDVTIGPWQQIYGELVAAGRLRAVDVARVTEAISDILYGIAFTTRFAGHRDSFEARSRMLLDILLRGILSEAERARRVED